MLQLVVKLVMVYSLSHPGWFDKFETYVNYELRNSQSPDLNLHEHLRDSGQVCSTFRQNAVHPSSTVPETYPKLYLSCPGGLECLKLC